MFSGGRRRALPVASSGRPEVPLAVAHHASFRNARVLCPGASAGTGTAHRPSERAGRPCTRTRASLPPASAWGLGKTPVSPTKRERPDKCPCSGIQATGKKSVFRPGSTAHSAACHSACKQRSEACTHLHPNPDSAFAGGLAPPSPGRPRPAGSSLSAGQGLRPTQSRSRWGAAAHAGGGDTRPTGDGAAGLVEPGEGPPKEGGLHSPEAAGEGLPAGLGAAEAGAPLGSSRALGRRRFRFLESSVCCMTFSFLLNETVKVRSSKSQRILELMVKSVPPPFSVLLPPCYSPPQV